MKNTATNSDGSKALSPCECECGCGESATTRDESGADLCAACADYYLDADGAPVCSRDQGYETCRHCGGTIDWGPIQTRQYGANWREGHCDCRGWTDTERGSAWLISEGRAEVAP